MLIPDRRWKEDGYWQKDAERPGRACLLLKNVKTASDDERWAAGRFEVVL
jgi:hypothetical protein